MENTGNQKYKVRVKPKWLLAGLISAAICVYFVIFISQFFWIWLPFTFTFLALSIDAL
ncbi:MAG: hypothetical protein R2794_10815 [Chitinophagales bacterium]